MLFIQKITLNSSDRARIEGASSKKDKKSASRTKSEM